MSAKHTPGPWKAAEWQAEGGEFGWSIYAGDPAHLVPTNTFETNSADEAEANARLFAAAPELLEASQMGHEDSPGLPCGDLLAAANVLRNHMHIELAERLETKHAAERAAIAKATGGAS